jgi:hypothetical protein
VAERTVSRLLPRGRRPPSQTWRTFLTNHMASVVSMDFFTVPTLTGRVLFVLVLLAQQRRRIVHVNITEHPTADWAAQQVVEAFPDDTTPRWWLRDRDSIYGDAFRRRVAGMGITELLPVHRVLGKIHWRNGSLAPFGASASTTSSFSVRHTCADCFRRTSCITTEVAPISAWTRTRLTTDRSKPQRPDTSSRFPKSVVFITAMIVGRRKRPGAWLTHPFSRSARRILLRVLNSPADVRCLRCQSL